MLAHLSFQENDLYSPYNAHVARYTVAWPLAYETAHEKKPGTYCWRSIAYQVHKYVQVPGTTSYEHTVAYTWYCCTEYLYFLYQQARVISFLVLFAGNTHAD